MLHPRTSQRTKDKETLDVANSGQLKVSGSGERNTILGRSVNPKERERIPKPPAVQEVNPGEMEHRKVRVLREKKSRRRASLSSRASVQKVKPAIF